MNADRLYFPAKRTTLDKGPREAATQAKGGT